MHDQVSIGDTLEVVAPSGRFTFTGAEADDIVLIAGGVGITPMMSIARGIAVIWSNRIAVPISYGEGGADPAFELIGYRVEGVIPVPAIIMFTDGSATVTRGPRKPLQIAQEIAELEAKMAEVVKEGYEFERRQVERDEAEELFADDPLKLERLAELTRADASLLKLLLKQLEKVERIWEQHFHDDTKELFGWDDDEGHFISELSAKLRKHVRLDVAFLKEVLDKLQDFVVLRRQKRGEKFWYELYHDIFSQPIDKWNRDFKTRQSKRFVVRLHAIYRFVEKNIMSLIIAAPFVYIGQDFLANRQGYYLQISPRPAVSDRIEIYRGTTSGTDLFGQREFSYESLFRRREIEIDKRFNQASVEDKKKRINLFLIF